MKKEYSLILTPRIGNKDKLVLDYIYEKYGESIPYIYYTLPYTLPYQDKWSGIIDYERACMYHPFVDETTLKIAIIDLSEWVLEEKVNENYLSIFFMYLHDQRTYFDFKYVFTVGTADINDNAVKNLIVLLSQYFEEGSIKEISLMKNPVELGEYICKKHKRISTDLAAKIACLVIESEVNIAITQLDCLLSGFENAFPDKRTKIDEHKISYYRERLRFTGLFLIYEKEFEMLIEKYQDKKEKIEFERSGVIG